jgi:hypothetical protein
VENTLNVVDDEDVVDGVVEEVENFGLEVDDFVFDVEGEDVILVEVDDLVDEVEDFVLELEDDDVIDDYLAFKALPPPNQFVDS